MQTSDEHAALQAKVRALLAPLVAEDELTFASELTQLYASDVFYTGRLPAGILRPRSIATMARAILAATEAGLAVAARGGGLSYSSGYVSPDRYMLLIDTQRLAAISDIDASSGTVTVEAGCTWAALHERLTPQNWRTPFWGTSSGRDSTIGGALSQNAVLYGSGRHGTIGDNVAEMAVVLSDGTIRRVSAATEPDAFRAFIGDGGALGIKASITLPVEPLPATLTYASCQFAETTDAIRAMSQLGPSGVAAECFLYGHTFADRNIPPAERTGPFIEPVPGYKHRTGAPLELHATIEGDSHAKAEAKRATLLQICTSHNGTEIADSPLRFLRKNPFGPPMLMLGPEGKRWVPTNFIVPHGRHADMLAAINMCMMEHREIIARHDITWSWSSLLVGREHVLIEPALYWKDETSPIMRATLDPAVLDGAPQHAADTSARKAVGELRAALMATGLRNGAAHIQTGRAYPASARFQAPDSEIFIRLKQALDPHGLMNPGVLEGGKPPSA